MTYQKDQTGIRQTAARVASELTVAELAAGIIKSHDTATKRFAEFRDEVFTDLDALRVVDNEMFKAEEAAAPKSSKGGGSRKGGGGSKAIDDPGSVVIKNGKFDGKTVEDVYAMSASEAEDYGYTDKEGKAKAGKEYIRWLSTNEKNPFMSKVCTAFLEAKRAESDA